MTYYCATCDVNWPPAKTRAGACVQCGGGTVRTHELPSPDADARYRTVLEREAAVGRSLKRHSDFEEFYAERQAAIDALELRELPVCEAPEGEAA